MYVVGCCNVSSIAIPQVCIYSLTLFHLFSEELFKMVCISSVLSLSITISFLFISFCFNAEVMPRIIFSIFGKTLTCAFNCCNVLIKKKTDKDHFAYPPSCI